MKNINIKEIVKVMIVFVLCVVFMLVVKTELTVDERFPCVEINKEAELYYNDKLVCSGDIQNYSIQKPKYGDIVTIKTKIKNNEIKNAILAFDNIYNLGYEVRIDGKKIKSYGMKAKKNSIVSNRYERILLKENIKGKELEINLRCTNESTIANIPSLLYMNGNDFSHACFYSQADYIFLSAILIEIGLVVLVFMCVNVMLKIFNMKNIYVGLVSISVGVWIIATFQINMFFTDIVKVDFYMEYIALACALFFCNMYVQELYGEEKEAKWLKVINFLLVCVTVVSVILQENCIVHMNDSIIATHILVIPMIVLLLKKFYMEEKNDKAKSTWAIIMESMVIISGFIFYIVMHLFVVNSSFSSLNLIVLIFILLIGQAILRIAHEMKIAYSQNAETRSISKLAYLDTLTGLANRRGLDKFVENMKELAKDTEYVVCSFDLNKLKQTNDTYGHAAGDLLIKSFAKELKSYINTDEEYCGRMGGDEFLALIVKDRAQDVLKKLKKSIDEKNKSGEFEYTVKYSVGTANYNIKEETDIYECIRLADYEMYEMKAAYHRRG